MSAACLSARGVVFIDLLRRSRLAAYSVTSDIRVMTAVFGNDRLQNAAHGLGCLLRNDLTLYLSFLRLDDVSVIVEYLVYQMRRYKMTAVYYRAEGSTHLYGRYLVGLTHRGHRKVDKVHS